MGILDVFFSVVIIKVYAHFLPCDSSSAVCAVAMFLFVCLSKVIVLPKQLNIIETMQHDNVEIVVFMGNSNGATTNGGTEYRSGRLKLAIFG